VAAFRAVADQMGVDFSLLTEVEKINVQQKKRFLAKIRAALWTLRGKKIAALGLAFKGETDDIRESPAVELVEMLLEEGCLVHAYDPAAMERTRELLPESAKLKYAADAYAAADSADALIVLTDWREFAELDLKRLYTTLRHPIVIDGRNLFDPQVMQAHGFTYVSIGRPSVNAPVSAPTRF
jgi:UDPglucose 6-dehydrogenase